MYKCKNCGAELPKSDFDFYFAEEALKDRTCDTCSAKEKERAKKVIDFESKLHPEWQGPTKGVWPQ